jgi:hypothetical protein
MRSLAHVGDTWIRKERALHNAHWSRRCGCTRSDRSAAADAGEPGPCRPAAPYSASCSRSPQWQRRATRGHTVHGTTSAITPVQARDQTDERPNTLSLRADLDPTPSRGLGPRARRIDRQFRCASRHPQKGVRGRTGRTASWAPYRTRTCDLRRARADRAFLKVLVTRVETPADQGERVVLTTAGYPGVTACHGLACCLICW